MLFVGFNVQFEGDVGGEFFNGVGKIDIFICVDDCNIFIGECKVWLGLRIMDDVLKQLFGYFVWCDIKVVILFFICNKDVIVVIDNVIVKIKEYLNYKCCFVYWVGVDQYEFIMYVDGDFECEIYLILIFFVLCLIVEVLMMIIL